MQPLYSATSRLPPSYLPPTTTILAYRAFTFWHSASLFLPSCLTTPATHSTFYLPTCLLPHHNLPFLPPTYLPSHSHSTTSLALVAYGHGGPLMLPGLVDLD